MGKSNLIHQEMADLEIQRQADMLEQKGMPIEKKVPLIEKDKQTWDSADQHFIKSEVIPGESDADRAMRLEAEKMQELALKKKGPLIKKDNKRWDSADQHNIQNTLGQM